MSIQQSVAIELYWGPRFQLSNSFMLQENVGGGIYMWGFGEAEGEVTWYVGKATAGKGGLYRRLRKHYLDIMSGQYQIPRDFLPDPVISSDCPRSGWRIKFGDENVAEILGSWERMEPIFRAGHKFANEAFARIAPLLDETLIKDIESAAIHDLRPLVNRQRPTPSRPIELHHHLSSKDRRWLQSGNVVHPDAVHYAIQED